MITTTFRSDWLRLTATGWLLRAANKRQSDLPTVNSMTKGPPLTKEFRHHHDEFTPPDLEVPLLTLLLALVTGTLWFATRSHGLRENNISIQNFLSEVLPTGLVGHLEVVNSDFIRVVMKYGFEGDKTASYAHSRKNSYAHSRMNSYAHSKMNSYAHSRMNSYAHSRKNVYCFDIEDVHNLEVWLKTRNPQLVLPPIYYKNEVDQVAVTRSVLLGITVTAFALSTLNILLTAPKTVHHSTFTGAVQTSSFQDKILNFGKAHPILGKDIPKTTFSDVAGCVEAKREISEFVDFLKDPGRFTKLGARIPRGALITGPPGTGKTLLARAVAGEANVPFYSMAGSDFVELFVGVGSSRVRDLFDRARSNRPAIIFIDEIDTIGRSRNGPDLPGGSEERESTLNALLVELDGFANSQAEVVVLAGTNRPDVLDKALIRPGRFDRRITLSMPSLEERQAIFELHLQPLILEKPSGRPSLARKLAALTPGISGAEIKAICNEGAIMAARESKRSLVNISIYTAEAFVVRFDHIEAAIERHLGGVKLSQCKMSNSQRRQVAIHEAGHAVMGWFLAHSETVLKLSIVPRANGSLGYTQVLPDEIQLLSREALMARIAVLLGGRASESLFSSSITTGASDDLAKATRLAYYVVGELGFDTEVGLISIPGFAQPVGEYYSNVVKRSPISEQTSSLIDKQVRRILSDQWKVSIDLLSRKEMVKAILYNKNPKTGSKSSGGFADGTRLRFYNRIGKCNCSFDLLTARLVGRTNERPKQ